MKDQSKTHRSAAGAVLFTFEVGAALSLGLVAVPCLALVVVDLSPHHAQLPPQVIDLFDQRHVLLQGDHTDYQQLKMN